LVDNRFESSAVEDRIEPSLRIAVLGAAPVALTQDFTRTYGGWAAGGTCRIRIFESPMRPPVIVCSQLECTLNASICSVAEYLAASVIGRYCPGRLDDPTPAIWIEHHPVTEDRRRRGAGRLDAMRVTFSSWKPLVIRETTGWRSKLGEPSWTPIDGQELRELIGDLAAIGE
jgi:hypothetical protein